jgi:hypothetical protein
MQLIRDTGCDIVNRSEWVGCLDRASRDDGASLLNVSDWYDPGVLCKAFDGAVTVISQQEGNATTLVITGVKDGKTWNEVVVDTRDC